MICGGPDITTPTHLYFGAGAGAHIKTHAHTAKTVVFQHPTASILQINTCIVALCVITLS